MANSIERTGKIFMPGIKKDEDLLIENASKKLKEEKELNAAKELFLEARKAKQAEIDAKIEKLEILPLGSRVIFVPYPENPYKKIITDSGIIVDYNGSFMNPDSGEKDTLTLGIGCGKIIEVGPECKYAKSGDDFYYDTRVVQPIPFYNQGYQTLAEQQIICILNEGLTDRFNELKK